MRLLLCLLAGASALLFCPLAVRAADATLVWAPNNEADLAGYKIYYDSDMSGEPYSGTDAIEGPSPVVVPLETLADPGNPELTLHGLAPCKPYYLAVSAYDTSNNESPLSGEAIRPFLLPSVEPLTATVESPTSVLVSWTGLSTAEGGGTLVNYRLTAENLMRRQAPH